ncbi:MAG: rhodanese-like domain-containing protein [Nitrospirota bacterium]
MDRKKKIYILYAAIFVSTMVFGAANYLLKIAEVKRGKVPVYKYAAILPNDLKEMMKQNSELIIVDTRIKEHFNEGHIKGAVNLSYTSLKSMNKVLQKEKSKDIVIYSEDGERSRKICEILVNLGYSKISNLDSGIKGWIDSGGEVVKEP